MSQCVCGHSRVDHRDTLMSVPLTRKSPIYPLPGTGINNVAFPHPTATYDAQSCWCGCETWEEL